MISCDDDDDGCGCAEPLFILRFQMVNFVVVVDGWLGCQIQCQIQCQMIDLDVVLVGCTSCLPMRLILNCLSLLETRGWSKQKLSNVE